MEIIYSIFVIVTMTSAQNTASNCGVVPMFQWSGATTKRVEPLSNPVGLVVIQHTGTAACTTDPGCETLTSAIQNYQVKSRGFDDIGQSFLIGGNGKVYEGAGWEYVGAHTKGYNKMSVGISFIGEFISQLPTPQALQAAQSLLACGVTNNFLTKNYRLVGHRQVTATESPGTTLQAEIQTWPNWVENL